MATMFVFICKWPDYGINGDYEVSADATDLKREAWNHRFEFQKRSQLFICAHNETLSFVAVCASAIQIIRPLEPIAETDAITPTAPRLAPFEPNQDMCLRDEGQNSCNSALLSSAL
jgi:hypothetical protein